MIGSRSPMLLWDQRNVGRKNLLQSFIAAHVVPSETRKKYASCTAIKHHYRSTFYTILWRHLDCLFLFSAFPFPSWSAPIPLGFLINGKFSAFCHTACHCLSGSRPSLMKSRIVATVLQAKKGKCSIVASEQWKLDVPFQIHVTNAFILQVLPSEKEMKQDLMNNAIYNEYNVEELQTTFRYVRKRNTVCRSTHTITFYHFRSIGKCCSVDFFRNHLSPMTCLLSTIRHI